MGRKVQLIEDGIAKNDHERGFAARLDAIMRHWSKNGRQISRPLKITFISFFALTVAGLTAQDFVSEYRNITQRLGTTVATAKSFLRHQERVGAAGLEKALLGLSVNPKLIDAYHDDDPYALQRVTSSLFPEMKELHRISEFTIFNADLDRVISAHKAITRSEKSNSFLVEQAAKSESVTSGFEIGDNGTNIIAVVRPWTADGRVVGYLKLAMEIHRPLNFIGKTLNADVFEVHEIDRLVPGTPPANGRNGWTLSDKIAYRPVGDVKLPHTVATLIATDPLALSDSNRIFLDGRTVKIAYNFQLNHADGTLGSSLVLVQDITPVILASLRHMGMALLIGCIIAAVAGAVVYRLVHSLQASVIKTRQKLEEEVAANTDALNHSQERLIEAQKIASLGSWERNLQTDELFWSEEMYRIAGLPKYLPPHEARDRLYKHIPPCERPYVETIMALAVAECRDFDFEHQIVHPDGEALRVHVRGYVVADEKGNPIKVLGTTHNITEHHNAQVRSKRLADILEASLNEIFVFDSKTLGILHANKCALDNLDYTMSELTTLHIWDIVASKDQETLRASFKPLLDGTTNVLSIEGMHRRKDGTEYPVEVRLQLHKHQDQSVFVAICNDLSERTARERETQAAREVAERIAYFDELTGLPNRAACQRDATRLFDEEVANKPAFIIHLDIDNFKRINDTLGHSAGDACLEEAGERLKLCCVGLGTAYRWGGDEFVIIACSDTSDAEELCQRLNIVMRGPMEFEGSQVFPSVSIGVAQCPGDGNDFSTLLVHADLALYRSKEDGKDRWSFFTSDMKIDSDEEARTESELRRALREDEFFLVFQPQVNIRTQQVTGLEALVRWQHPTRGILGPGSFLPVVEKTNLATPLGQVVIDKALEAARCWQDANIDFGRIAVNLSPSHLTSGTLVTDFTSAMERHGVAPEFVTAEVLESVFLDSQRSNNSEVLETLHNLGVHIELDDFGTGYASLSHVADLPINGLKIDRSFTAQLLTDAKKEIVINHLIHLARSLDIDIVCEGVETNNQFDRLRMMGNFSVQGYFIARPMQFDAVTSWLASTQSDISFEAV
ncbi:putative bifunctional diguanylate cyclase/phosphodiesterase [Roseibium sp.]|uniref:putative bifunctional diguanylate cyclase/phosphodiesterase n=1 Tax=Roseibium sp. TaxID=1936156 RepID=UPI003A977635